uniref:Ig-like domain-containing protein n=1 Tax=Paramormyrops kingsleyae TaxID=1676925 RepID=A0A3B3Q606_9TELE
MSILKFLILTEDAITPFKDKVHVTEGENVTLSCNYSGSVTNLQWYRQYPRSAPEFLLLILEVTESVPNPKFDASLNTSAKTVPLTVQNVQLSDSAVYYCALSPTVRITFSHPLQKHLGH